MFVLNNNGASLYTRSHKIVNSIPAEETCVVYLGGEGIADSGAAIRLSDIVANEILLDMPNIPNISNYAYIYDGLPQDKQRHFQFEHYSQNIFTDSQDIQNLYITEQNINRIFRMKVTPLIKQGKTDINFVIDDNNDKLKNLIKLKLRDFDKEIQIALSKKIFTYDKFLKSSKYLPELFTATILPRITNKNGKPLPVNTVMRNMRKINFVTHCHGAYVALMLLEMMHKKLRDIGYSGADIKRIESQVLVTALNPACPLGVTNARVISFMSADDTKVPRPQNWLGIFLNAQDKKLWSKKLKPGFLSDKNGEVFYVQQRFNLAQGQISYNEHNNMHYYHEDMTPQGRKLMMLMRNVIMSGIKNSLSSEFVPLPETGELILNGTDDENIKKQFIEMKQNGTQLMASVYKFATARVHKMHADKSKPRTTRTITR